jgi:hypothetical protein
MLYNITDKENDKDSQMEKILSEILNILTYSEKMDKENNENISEVIDNIMMNYLWKK